MADNLDLIIDISVNLSDQTILYPGDPRPEYGLASSIASGGDANVGYLKQGIHLGTHVDVPWHFQDGGRKLDQIPLEYWLGRCLVVDATQADRCVGAHELQGIPLKQYPRILFKTRNSLDYGRRREFASDFIFLDKSACDLLAAAGVLTVGLDYTTVDPYGSPDYPAHHTLLGNGICIIEYVDLSQVEPGEYYLMCLPLKMVGTDGAPARAVLLRPGFYA